ncbi:hypothetical protein L6E12_03820 [Actinokineospora sp. PR83]|nr:hypothetical protein [Actinokineospora sp. PR83]MCG8914917.1 hypothetical protein [Actinokineospora sp. PR83]
MYLDAGVLAGAEQLEGLTHQWAALWVYSDRADFAAFGLGFTSVVVAKRSGADRTTVFSLLSHFVLYVGTTGFGLILVDGMDDRLHHRALRAFAHVEHRGDDADTHLFEVPLGDTCVDAISEDTIEVVDDDVINVFLPLHPGDHFLEDRAFVDTGRRAARFHEFFDNVRAE